MVSLITRCVGGRQVEPVISRCVRRKWSVRWLANESVIPRCIGDHQMVPVGAQIVFGDHQMCRWSPDVSVITRCVGDHRMCRWSPDVSEITRCVGDHQMWRRSSDVTEITRCVRDHQMVPVGTQSVLFWSCSILVAIWVHISMKLALACTYNRY